MESAAAVSVQTGTASAADSYYCSKPYDPQANVWVAECIHLGGNGYWQPYVRVENDTDSAVAVGSVGDQQWINSGGALGDYKSLPSGTVNPGITNLWGQSTNWRNTCYVQGQADVWVNNGTLQYNSPSEYVC